MNPAQKTYTIGETAKILGLSIETLRRYDRSGKITAQRTPGGKRFFTQEDIDKIKDNLDHIHKPYHPINPTGEPHQVNLQDSSPKSDRLVVSISIPKVRIPGLSFGKAVIGLFVLLFIAENVMLFSKTPYPKQAVSLASKQVLGVESFIAPALEEVSPFLSPIGRFLSSTGNLVRLTIGSILVGFLPDYQTTKTVKISSENIPPNLTLSYLNVENDTSIGGNLEVLGNTTLSDTTVNNLTVNSNETIGGNLSVAGNITTGKINGTTITSNSLVFDTSSPTIYPSTLNSQLSINANGTGAINIGNGGTGDIYLGGGSTDTGCTLTNSTGSFNCSGNITSQGDLVANGGYLLTDKTTAYLFNTTATTLNIGGAATTVSLGSSAGTTTVNNALSVTGGTTLSSTLNVVGASTFNGAATFNSNVNITTGGQLSLNRVPTLPHTGTWAIGSSTWNQSDATIYVNPATATADSNIFALSVGGSVKFDVDAEGDIYGNNLVLTGSTTTASTTVSADLSVEGNTTLGDATTDTLTINPATVAFSGGNKTLDIAGAATRTLTILNSTSAQIADLDLSDGNLKVNGSTIITNAGAGSFTTIGGTLSTGSQTNITAVGTLTSLSVTGNINSTSGSLQTNSITRIDNSGNLTAGTGSFGGSITPGLDATYDFGSGVLRWKDAYFSGDVNVGDTVFKNKFRLTEHGATGIDMLNPKGEVIASWDEDGNFWVKGEIKHGSGN